jgi:hypothetical protein
LLHGTISPQAILSQIGISTAEKAAEIAEILERLYREGLVDEEPVISHDAT